MNISHSDCICPAGASTWDEAVYLNLSTLQEPSIRPLTHTRRRSERPTRVPLVRSFTLQHSHPFWVSVLRLYSSVCFHCVKLFNVTSKHNSLCILRLKWNTLVVEKLRCCYGFMCTTKHFMIDSTTQCAGRREGGEPVILQTWSLFTSTRPHSTGILQEICLSDVLPRGAEEKIWQRTFLQRLMSRPRCAYSPVMFRHKTERLGLRKDHVLG